KDFDKVAGIAHLVGGVEHLVAGSVFRQQFLVGAEAAGGYNGLFGQDVVALVVVGLDRDARHAVAVPDKVHAGGAGADVHTQLIGQLFHVVHDGLAGVGVGIHHVVAQAVGIVQLGAHIAQPGVGGELFFTPDLHPL